MLDRSPRTGQGCSDRFLSKGTDMIAPTQKRLEATKEEAHPSCTVCRAVNPLGLELSFSLRDDGGIQAEFPCSRFYQGYPGFLHGGVTSLLLDAAMTNCLFAYGKTAVTARLIVRFLSPVAVDRTAVVKSWLTEYEPPLYVLEAEVEQNGRALVRASAKFIDHDLAVSFDESPKEGNSMDRHRKTLFGAGSGDA